jgi:hypothetical protein
LKIFYSYYDIPIILLSKNSSLFLTYFSLRGAYIGKYTEGNGMNLESLDLDLLDEQARKVLGYAGKNEVVIYREKNQEKTDLQIKN